MSIILNIDTSIEIASVSITKDGVILASSINKTQKEHASFLHITVQKLLTKAAIEIKQVDAIAVANGPGSYTGLRVGLASAKGFCYALNKPLITIGTLNVLAESAINSLSEKTSSTLFCPMIDARRMEVYTAIFDSKMNEIMPACAMILNKDSFRKILQENHVLFFGSGAIKWKTIIETGNGAFINELDTTTAIAQLSYRSFLNRDFTDLTYSEPFYVKEFFTP